MAKMRVNHYRVVGSGSLSFSRTILAVDPPETLVLFFSGYQYRDQHFDCPGPARESRRNRRRRPQRLVGPDEVVDEIVEGDGVLVVAPFLAECVC